MIRVFVLMLAAFALPYVIARILKAAGLIKQPITAVLGIVMGLGAALVMLFIIVLVDTESSSRDGAYQPPRLEDGQIRPGQFEDRDPPPPDEPI